MSKGNTFENDLMKLIFNGTAISKIADNASVTPLTNLYLALHTDNPGEGGTQTTNEANYTDYGRVAVARAVGVPGVSGFTVSGAQATNAALVQFIISGGGTNVVSYVSIGTDDYPAAGKILYSGALSAPRTITVGIQPQFSAGDLIFEED